MPSAEPSPRTWRVEKAPDECRFWIARAADGVSIGMAWRECDAALIVDAVNGRDRLLDLVRRLADDLERFHLVGERDRALLREARAALMRKGKRP